MCCSLYILVELEEGLSFVRTHVRTSSNNDEFFKQYKEFFKQFSERKEKSPAHEEEAKQDTIPPPAPVTDLDSTSAPSSASDLDERPNPFIIPNGYTGFLSNSGF